MADLLGVLFTTALLSALIGIMVIVGLAGLVCKALLATDMRYW